MSFRWRSESDTPAPTGLVPVDDSLSADEALKRVSRGEFLLYAGDFQNAKQLVAAMGRRLLERKGVARSAGRGRSLTPPALERPSNPERKGRRTTTALEAFHEERKTRQLEHETLGRVLVSLDREYRLSLGRAPDVALACRQVWGEADSDVTVVPLKTLLGMLGAAEWRRKGLEVPGLAGKLTPHYGVYLPTRTDYVELLSHVGEVKGRSVFDIGTGTGVLSFILLQRGAASVVATDVEARAIACATENAERLGLGSRFRAIEAELFPEGQADLVVCNPPWIPEKPKNRVDRAVFDGDRFLERFLEQLPAHLTVGGSGLLLLSDLAVLLGLRPEGWLEGELARTHLTLKWKRSAAATHGKAKDRTDALHAARSRETTTLYCLSA